MPTILLYMYFLIMQSKEKEIRFRSCFICEVIIRNESIELVDSVHMSLFIDKKNEELMQMFKDWFVNIYKACIPQTLTVVQHHVESKDGEPTIIVDKLFYRKNDACTTMINESKNNDANAKEIWK